MRNVTEFGKKEKDQEKKLGDVNFSRMINYADYSDPIITPRNEFEEVPPEKLMLARNTLNNINILSYFSTD